ncbi:dihydroxy-acid dehydratase [Verminephrobacter eiseniae]|uniref:dihydroxy-acid dehydratase n=1 Tax=Verminephrobacter eiseniae TaxID=364317 RepID=UPI002239071B|nr:dihydroxy-acid dehydratase [Verminephrobacter eiseniae]
MPGHSWSNLESQEDAMAALSNGEITNGQMIVLRGLGARGGPGVASASWFVAAVNGAHLGDDIAVITDGQFSGLNHGFTIGHVLPEAADDDPIALVRDGDTVAIDIARRTVDLLLDASEWQALRVALAPFVPGEKKGWLSLYQHLVQPRSKGGTLTAKG